MRVREPDDVVLRKELTLAERAITDAAVVGAGTLIGPAGPVIAAFAIPYVEEMVSRLKYEFSADAKERIAAMLCEAAQSAECAPEEFERLARQTDRTRLLTATAIDAAARTWWPAKVIGLGRVLASGLIAADDARIDEEQLALAAMADMERPHVSLLELLVRWEPRRTSARFKVEPYVPPEPRNDKKLPWRAYRRVWTDHAIVLARPQLGPVLTSLMGTLLRHGLAVQNDNTAQALERYSAKAAEDVNRRSMRGGAGRQTVPAAPRKVSLRADEVPALTWSPTELGEQVLGFYELAAESGTAEAGAG